MINYSSQKVLNRPWMIPLDSKTHEPVEYRTQDCTVQQVDDVSCYLFFFFNKMHFEQILIFTKSSKLQIACLVQDKLYIQHSKEQNDVLTRQFKRATNYMSNLSLPASIHFQSKRCPIAYIRSDSRTLYFTGPLLPFSFK